MNLRLARIEDLQAIVAIDPNAQRDDRRVGFVRHAIESGSCWLAEEPPSVLGYVVVDYSFYGNGFIPLLFVSEPARRGGIGSALIEEAVRQCNAAKLFTSTNLSNVPMQGLLAKLAFQLTGVIHNLDPADPELVYYRRVR